MRTIKNAVSSGFSSLNSIKLGTRATMGNCQGRTCSQTINNLIQTMTRVKPQPLSFRPPLKPVSLDVFAEE